MTLGFGEIVPIVFLNAEQFTEGTNGIGGIYKPDIPFIEFTLLNPWPFYVLMGIIVTITIILIYRIQESRVGRSWMAIREDELAAAANGLNTVTTKLLAFALGASTAGLAGVFNASKLTLVSPDQFLSTVSFSILAMVVLGGMGNIWGVAARRVHRSTRSRSSSSSSSTRSSASWACRSSRTSTSCSTSSCSTASRSC